VGVRVPPFALKSLILIFFTTDLHRLLRIFTDLRRGQARIFQLSFHKGRKVEE
jgi:hypothetical protein